MRRKSENTIEQIKNMIENFFLQQRRFPSITEIAKSIGHSRSTVHGYLHEMDKHGILVYNGKEKTIETDKVRKINNNTVFTPVVGDVPCGMPQIEEENIEEYIPMPAALLGKGEFFILRANGDSMIEAGISSGDLVIVKKQNTANEGDIVVALIDNENTLKRFYTDRNNNRIRLHPENSKMEDIYVTQCYIQGVAQKVIKNLQ